MNRHHIQGIARTTAAVILAGLVVAGSAFAVDRVDARTIDIQLGVYGGQQGSFHPDQEVAFYVEAAEECYLAVYNIDTSGRVALLFPSDPSGGRVEGGRRYRVPERGAEYGLFLGSTPGVEFVVAVASHEAMDLDRFFPDGEFVGLDDIYREESLEAEGLSEETWVLDDPFVAMDFIGRRLAPDGQRSGGFGESYVTLRLGGDDYNEDDSGYGDEGDSDYGRAGSGSDVQVIHVYHDWYGYDPFWDPWWHPWYYRPVVWMDPWWSDPWCGGPRSYVSYGYASYPYGYWPHSGVGIRVAFGWRDSWHHHHGVTSPSYYWGSQVKWKTASAVATGGPRDVKWKQDGAQLIPASTAIRTRPSSRNAVAVNRDERVKTRETVSRETVAQETVVRDKVARDKSESRDKSGSAEKSERVVKKDVVKKDTVKKPKAAKPAKEKSPQETVKPRESKQKRDVQRSRSARSESRYEIAMPAERVARKPERVVKPGRDDAPLRGDRFVSRERVRPERASRTAPPTRDHRMADRGGGHRGAKGR